MQEDSQVLHRPRPRTRIGFRGLAKRFSLRALLASAALLVTPSAAFACKPTDPQGPYPSGDECTQTFDAFYPTMMGEQVGGYAIENIPKGAVEIKYSLSFSPEPSNASLSQSFNPDATDKNPDGSYPNPPPGDQAARVIYNWTGNGSSSPPMGTATYTVTFEEPTKPFQVVLSAKEGRHKVSSVRPGENFDWYVHVHNPNDDSVTGDLVISIGGHDFVTRDIEYNGGIGKCRVSVVYYSCPVELAAGESASVTVFGHYKTPRYEFGYARVGLGDQDPDHQEVGTNKPGSWLKVVEHHKKTCAKKTGHCKHK